MYSNWMREMNMNTLGEKTPLLTTQEECPCPDQKEESKAILTTVEDPTTPRELIDKAITKPLHTHSTTSQAPPKQRLTLPRRLSKYILRNRHILSWLAVWCSVFYTSTCILRAGDAVEGYAWRTESHFIWWYYVIWMYIYTPYALAAQEWCWADEREGVASEIESESNSTSLAPAPTPTPTPTPTSEFSKEEKEGASGKVEAKAKADTETEAPTLKITKRKTKPPKRLSMTYFTHHPHLAFTELTSLFTLLPIASRLVYMRDAGLVLYVNVIMLSTVAQLLLPAYGLMVDHRRKGGCEICERDVRGEGADLV